jgi:hypothetical protein
MALRGHAGIAESDVALVMLVGGGFCALSALVFRRLSPAAGAAVYTGDNR